MWELLNDVVARYLNIVPEQEKFRESVKKFLHDYPPSIKHSMKMKALLSFASYGTVNVSRMTVLQTAADESASLGPVAVPAVRHLCLISVFCTCGSFLDPISWVIVPPRPFVVPLRPTSSRSISLCAPLLSSLPLSSSASLSGYLRGYRLFAEVSARLRINFLIVMAFLQELFNKNWEKKEKSPFFHSLLEFTNNVRRLLSISSRSHSISLMLSIVLQLAIWTQNYIVSCMDVNERAVRFGSIIELATVPHRHLTCYPSFNFSLFENVAFSNV